MPLSPSDREHARADAALLVRSTPLARSRYLAEIMAEQGAAYLAEVEAFARLSGPSWQVRRFRGDSNAEVREMIAERCRKEGIDR